MQAQLSALSSVYPDPVRIEWKHIARARVENPSVTVRELSVLVGRSLPTIYVWLKQPLYQAYENWVFEQERQAWTPYERARKADVADEIQEHTGDMLDRLRVIAETTQDEKLAASISQDWLDRAGFGARSKQDRQTTFVLSGEAMRELLRRETESQGEVLVGEVVRSV